MLHKINIQSYQDFKDSKVSLKDYKRFLELIKKEPLRFFKCETFSGLALAVLRGESIGFSINITNTKGKLRSSGDFVGSIFVTRISHPKRTIKIIC